MARDFVTQIARCFAARLCALATAGVYLHTASSAVSLSTPPRQKARSTSKTTPEDQLSAVVEVWWLTCTFKLQQQRWVGLFLTSGKSLGERNLCGWGNQNWACSDCGGGGAFSGGMVDRLLLRYPWPSLSLPQSFWLFLKWIPVRRSGAWLDVIHTTLSSKNAAAFFPLWGTEHQNIFFLLKN